MKTIDKIISLHYLLKARIFNMNIPLAVRFQVTNRCTLQCKYCNLWKTSVDELSGEQIVKIIGELAKLGTKRISFSGGEPLLRGDIEEIVDFCILKGIYPEMNSNGTLVCRKIEVIKKLDFLKLSLDGPEEIHDAVRGSGSYKHIIEAAELAFSEKVKFGFACTLTRYNINHLDYVLKLAEKFHALVAFQPLKQIYRGVKDITKLVPEREDFRRAIEFLISEKQKGNANIRNSLRGLRHIYNWPKYKRLECWAGRIFCIICVNADITPCDRIDFNLKPINCLTEGVKESVEMLSKVNCSGCGFCGALELNYLMGLKFDVIFSIKKIIKNG